MYLFNNMIFDIIININLNLNNCKGLCFAYLFDINMNYDFLFNEFELI